MAWYSKRSMNILLSMGIMIAIFGVGAILSGATVAGAVLLSVGVGISMIATSVLKAHLKVEMSLSRRKRGPSDR
ncbi:MAG: hypothetical protein GX137_06570 [Thermoplasmatales archaeon]|nr:hypothetical protein [Thermoplasmatales archaeon]